jgi:hypothetical protein
VDGEEVKEGGDLEAWPANRSGLLAFIPAEEAQVAQVRRFYLSHIGLCRPLWLHPHGEVSFDFSLAELEAVWEMYEAALVRLLNCSIPEDRIRAVYPLFFSVPVNDHEELVSLVNKVADELEGKSSPGAQVARRHYFEIMGAAVIDEEEGDSQDLLIQRGIVSNVVSNAFSTAAFASARALTNLQSAFLNASDRLRLSNLYASVRMGPVTRLPVLEASSAYFPADDVSEVGAADDWDMSARAPRTSADSFRRPLFIA